MKKTILLGAAIAAILTGCGGGTSTGESIVPEVNLVANVDFVEDVDTREVFVDWAMQKKIDVLNKRRAEGWVINEETGERTDYQPPIVIDYDASIAFQKVLNDIPITSDNSSYTDFAIDLAKYSATDLAEAVKVEMMNDYTGEVVMGVVGVITYGDNSDVDSWLVDDWADLKYSYLGDNAICGVANLPKGLEANEYDGVIEDHGQAMVCWSSNINKR